MQTTLQHGGASNRWPSVWRATDDIHSYKESAV